MSFKENLLKKIKIDKMRSNVLTSLSTSVNGIKVDKTSMKYLLKEAGLISTRLRNIDMYISDETNNDKTIFVLDNELPIYNTNINDVALRKEPTLKEMISIRNAIKILNDSDVVVSKKEGSIETVYNKCLDRIDLSFNIDDTKQLEYDGRSAVEWKDSEAIIEILSMFSELLDYKPAPGILSGEHLRITGKEHTGNDKSLFGPAVVYNAADDSVKLIKESINLKKRESVDAFQEIVKGGREAFREGPEVIKFLADLVNEKNNLN